MDGMFHTTVSYDSVLCMQIFGTVLCISQRDPDIGPNILSQIIV